MQGKASAWLRDIHGSTVKEIFNGSTSEGVQTIFCDLEGFSAGTYFVVLRNNEKTIVEKVVKTR